MTEAQALAYIRRRGRFGELGLTRVRRLLADLGHPEERYAVAHIAGTNGKGSTAAFLAAILAADGRRVGLYTSPPLLNERERIRVDGVPIPGEELATLVSELAEGVCAHEADPATEFELWTALAFTYFARREVDVAVVEVGLGGRFDATNAVRRPAVTAITAIGLDHTDRLGDTLSAIAREKAGILKPKVPAVVGRLPPEAAAVVRSIARARGVPLHWLGEDFSARGQWREGRWWLELETESGTLATPLGLMGHHQLHNAALAVRLAELLGTRPAARAQGLAAARWPGRLEVLEAGEVVVDGAHNPDGAAALAASLATMFPGARWDVAYACLADRDPQALLAPLRPLMARLWAVPLLVPRALPQEEVLRRLPEAKAATLAEARAESRREGRRLLVTGSLYLVAEALRLWGEEGEGWTR